MSRAPSPSSILVVIGLVLVVTGCATSTPALTTGNNQPIGGAATPSSHPRIAPPNELAQQTVAFTHEDALYVARGDGSDRRLVTTFRKPVYPYAGAFWSPDGNQLIIRTEAQEGSTVNGYIFRVNEDGSNLVNLSLESGSRHDAMPAWSHDGNSIVYVSTKPGDPLPALYVMGSDGSAPRRLAELGFEVQYPSWSATGRIAFTGVRDGGFDIFSIDADGSGLEQLTDDPGDNLWPSYSPDGSRIAFFSNRDGTDAIWVMDADGGNPRRTTDGGEPNWSPRGDWITFNCGVKPVVCASRPDGSQVFELFGDAGFPTIRP